MRVTSDDFVGLTGFSLLWRWTEDTHAKFGDDDLASIRPIRSAKAAMILDEILRVAPDPDGEADRIVANDDVEASVVSKWLEDRIPRGKLDVLLLWDRQRAALVPRQLFVERWDDFWYPSSDDLTVIGSVGPWRIEMYHDGTFDFLVKGAVEQGVEPDGRCAPAG
jgi:hypothetical protein